MGTLKDKFVGKVRQAAGFTLIELLVVVAIIGILAAIAIPIFLSQTNKAKESGAQSNVTSALTDLGTLSPSFNESGQTQATVKTGLEGADKSVAWKTAEITTGGKNEVYVLFTAAGATPATEPATVEFFAKSGNGTIYCSAAGGNGETKQATVVTAQAAGTCAP